ncbi:hypothetical protein AB0B78_31070 [Streptomyces sp. NPDC040724]|uniref:hypothetical protein n=1 Tax=Streptomyces sp. NPDC040724 TaxID=3155612 RepID=UPI00340C5C79
MASTVLVLTTLEDVTADLVISALNERETPVVRADPADLGAGLSFGARIGAGAPAWGGRLVTGSRQVELGKVAAVYYRRPTPWDPGTGTCPPSNGTSPSPRPGTGSAASCTPCTVPGTSTTRWR